MSDQLDIAVGPRDRGNKRMTGQTGSAMAKIRDTIIAGNIASSFAFREWRKIAETAIVSAELSIIRWANQSVHLLGTVVPAWLSWFSDNWFDVFTDVVNYTGIVTENIGKNLVAMWDGVVSFMNGDGFTFEWTPLTEGFRSAIKELPQIAEREMGPLEKELQDRLNELADDLVGDFGDHRKDFIEKTQALLASGSTDGPDGPDKKDRPEPDERPDFNFAGMQQRMKRQIAVSFSTAAIQGQAISGPERSLMELLKEQRRHNREQEMHNRRQQREGFLR